MKVTSEKIENSQAFLTIEMEPPEVEEALEKSYHRLVRRAKIPGFRQGKAPRTVLERYLGRERLLEDALNDVLPQACEKAIAEQALEAIAQPQVEVTQVDPMVFKVVVPLKPKVKLGDYHQIQLAPEPAVVTENDVDGLMEQLRHDQATWEPVERPASFGDRVALDIESSIDGESFINQKGAQYQVLSGSAFPTPGFAEQMVGMKPNEEKDFKLQFPSDYPRNELAGKEPSFKIKVTEVKQEILPELNDGFASGINPEFKTLDLLRGHVSSELKLRAEEKSRLDFEERVVDAVVDLSELEFPPILVETEINRILNQSFQRDNQKLEEYLQNVNKTEVELREELRPLATQRIKRSLVLGKVVEEEKLETDDSEIDAEIENMVKSSTGNKDELTKTLNIPSVRESIKNTLITRKAVQRLAEIARDEKETKTVEEVKK